MAGRGRVPGGGEAPEQSAAAGQECQGRAGRGCRGAVAAVDELQHGVLVTHGRDREVKGAAFSEGDDALGAGLREGAAGAGVAPE